MKIRPSLVSVAVLGASVMPAAFAAGQDVLDPDAWPRSYQVGGAEVAIYMPQILDWSGFRHLKANAAIGVKLEAGGEVSFGAVAFEADTIADFERGNVSVGTRTLSGFRFPELDAAGAAKAEALVRSVLTPESPMDLPLATVTAAVDRGGVTTADAGVSFEPPPIFFSDSAAVLLTFTGEPKLEPAVNDDPSLMFAVNTNWDVLFVDSQYYFLAGNQWLVTKDLAQGPWAPATAIPEAFRKLPDEGNWADVKAKLFVLPGSGAAPRVFVSNRPAEIIVTEGKPQFAPISGTSLMYVANTEGDLFYDMASKTYYYLAAGRWFGATAMEGPWKAATDTLPDDFAKIPATHPKADVLVSVKGTPEADEAVILASIPQTATVTRAQTTIQVNYDGEPQFRKVPGTSEVEFAVNTDSDVFRVSAIYYCCDRGIWFQAPAATGAWIVCDKVPDAVYTIPPQSPKYHVTHVHVYDSTPDTVQVGVTSGYSGAYVANGLVVFGLGMWLGNELADDDVHVWHGHYYPKPCWYGYGCGAVYHPGQGYCRRGGYCYGPYGGAGYGAVYNPATGAYARGAIAYGPRGAAGARVAYNPWTDTTAGRVGVSTPYGSWGRSAVVRDDEWVRAGHRSGARGSVGGIQTSGGGAAVGVDRRFGSDAIVAKSGSGDIYVGKDGNFYKKDQDGGWQKREQGGWNRAPEVDTLPANPSRNADAARIVDGRQGQSPKLPGTGPNDPKDRPAKATTLPSKPATLPGKPANPPAKPATLPAKPSTAPSPSTDRRGSYTNKGQSTGSQLNRDASSRQRGGNQERPASGRPETRERRR